MWYRTAWSLGPDHESGRGPGCGLLPGTFETSAAAEESGRQWCAFDQPGARTWAVRDDETLFEALKRVGSDPCHGGDGWNVRAQLANGDLVSLPLLDAGRGWARLRGVGGDGGGIFLTEVNVLWAEVVFGGRDRLPEAHPDARALAEALTEALTEAALAAPAAPVPRAAPASAVVYLAVCHTLDSEDVVHVCADFPSARERVCKYIRDGATKHWGSAMKKDAYADAVECVGEEDDPFGRGQVLYAESEDHNSWVEVRRTPVYAREKPKYYRCGICSAHHPLEWDGDCRDDAYKGTKDYRFTPEELDVKHGPLGWNEVPMPGGEEGGEG